MEILNMFNWIEIAHAGVLSDAPSIAEIGANILNFLLRLFGIVGIIALVIAGITYLRASGDAKMAESARKAVVYIITGLIVGLGAVIIFRQIIYFLR